MSATKAPYFKPPWAVTAWADATDVYIEVPSKTEGEPPYITKYPLSEAGFARALHYTRELYEANRPKTPIDYTRHPKVRRVPMTATNSQFTEEQREKARDVLRRLRII